MLGHIGINVPDLVAAREYYDELMPLVGFEPFLVSGDQVAYRPAGGRPGTFLFFYAASDRAPYSAEQTGLQHLAFTLRTRGDVDQVHRTVRSAGARVLHAPRVFPEYPQPYYATFWLDPLGIMLEAVCHHDRDWRSWDRAPAGMV